jgi:MFS family permease
MSAMRAGIRYVRNSTSIQATLIHIGLFSFFSSALWAFLPIVARKYLGLSAFGYGSLLGFFGVGGLLGASLLPWLRQALSMNVLAAGSTFCFALAVLGLSSIRTFGLIALFMCGGGVCWMVLLSILTTAVQSVTPSWVRGRVLSVFMLVFFAGLAGGSALWGSLATWTGIPPALLVASGCLIIGGAVTWPFKLSGGEGLDLNPSRRWIDTAPVSDGLDLEEKPVLIVVEYSISPEREDQFMQAMSALKTIRLRDGAIRWNLLHDVADSRLYVESFIVESWVEHLRQHERLTVTDREILQRTRTFHDGKEEVKVRHFVLEPVKRDMRTQR